MNALLRPDVNPAATAGIPVREIARDSLGGVAYKGAGDFGCCELMSGCLVSRAAPAVRRL